MAFWKPDPADPSRIVRAARAVDDADGHQRVPAPHRQPGPRAGLLRRVHGERPRRRMTPDYGYEFRGLEVADEGEYPVTVTLRAHRRRPTRARSASSGPSTSSARTARAARCASRSAARIAGDQANHAWGVMDVLAVTDFPDIRTKCAIQSHDGGSILLIPREGGHLFRMYVDLGEVAAGRQRRRAQDHHRADHRQGERDPAPLHARRAQRRLAQRLRGGPPPHRPVRRRPPGGASAPARRACSSPATPATRTAPRPARA